MWFVIKFLAGLPILWMVIFGWGLPETCSRPGEVAPIELKIFTALFSFIFYPMSALDIGGLSGGYKNNPFSTEACVWKQFASLKSYVWLYLLACVISIIGMIEDKFKGSK